MHPRVKKTWVGAVGVALALSTIGGVALGAGADDWYTGGNATVPDPDKTAVALKLYDGSGAQVTSGSTTAPIAAFAAADGAVRTGDDYANLFVHLPQADTAPGAWPGVQVTGTDRFAGAGAVAAPAALTGKPYVRTTGDGYTLSEVAAGLPNAETGPSFTGVYELRLRTSSKAGGVSNEYAATYVKVTGSTWTVTSAPVLGGGGGEAEPVATTTTATWPSALTYGTAASVSVTVTPASGEAKPTGAVRLVSGTTTVSTAPLTAAGTASLPVARTALAPGARTLKVVYAGAADVFTASESAPRAYTVRKAAPGRPTLAVTKKPSAKKAGAATVAVPTAAGLVKAAGKTLVVLKKGRATKRVTVNVVAGKATVKLPKLPAGTWTVTVTYQGSAYYLASTSKVVKIRSKKK
ncbi:Ig-like domain-containing protein [Nocardioides sp. 503]|uniref:Ig-like domain-containing protein n=1 Tax=Nocardioides sp. 503 TaxID=2508326 RepID=UPI00106F5D9D|nr:Ig-like domain-containing protein [Nocardioides sp. 503]